LILQFNESDPFTFVFRAILLYWIFLMASFAKKLMDV